MMYFNASKCQRPKIIGYRYTKMRFEWLLRFNNFVYLTCRNKRCSLKTPRSCPLEWIYQYDIWIYLFGFQEYTLQAKFHRPVDKSSRDRRKGDQAIPKVHCPKFSKAKDEGWFMILGDPGIGELLALKRCSYRSYTSYHSVTFTAPQKTGELTLHT